LFSYLIAVNEKLTWNGSFLRGFPTRSVKTEVNVPDSAQEIVKTKASTWFTPAPWVAGKLDVFAFNGGYTIAANVTNDDDAQLIAAAPELYEALEEARGTINILAYVGGKAVGSPSPQAQLMTAKIDAVLAKARGEA
jgi:hypothetical protein